MGGAETRIEALLSNSVCSESRKQGLRHNKHTSNLVKFYIYCSMSNLPVVTSPKKMYSSFPSSCKLPVVPQLGAELMLGCWLVCSCPYFAGSCSCCEFMRALASLSLKDVLHSLFLHRLTLKFFPFPLP